TVRGHVSFPDGSARFYGLCKRRGAIRLAAFRPSAASMNLPNLPDYTTYPDARGHFGPFGGSFVAETLMKPLEELTAAWLRYRDDPQFLAELDADLRDYVGRPSPIYFA